MIIIQLLHPVQSGRDMLITATRIGAGIYQAPLTDLPAGHWYLLLEDGDWKLLKQLVFE
jgi:hypothetical protein